MSPLWWLAMYRKDSELHINIRREDGFSLSRSCKYFIHLWRKTPIFSPMTRSNFLTRQPSPPKGLFSHSSMCLQNYHYSRALNWPFLHFPISSQSGRFSHILWLSPLSVPTGPDSVSSPHLSPSYGLQSSLSSSLFVQPHGINSLSQCGIRIMKSKNSQSLSRLNCLLE